MYITLKYLEREKTLVLKEEVLKRLMSTSRGIPEPAVGEQDLPNFPTDLYSFLLCNYKANDLHVDVTSIPLLATLARAVRDLLQLTHSRIDPKNVPVQFDRKFERYLQQYRITAMHQVLSKKISSVRNARTIASSFLSLVIGRHSTNTCLSGQVPPLSCTRRQ
jgi:hypothetical protein